MLIRKAQGFALIDLIFVCGIIGLLSSIALPRLMLAKQAAGASSAIGSMRTLASAQLTYALVVRQRILRDESDDARHAATRQQRTVHHARALARQHCDPERLPLPARGRCRTRAHRQRATASPEGAQGFRAGADPTTATNPRFFAVNASGMIYEHNSTLYADMPEVGEPPFGQSLR